MPKRVIGPNETPVVKETVPGMGYRAALHPREDLGAEVSVNTKNGDSKSGRFMRRCRRRRRG